MSDLFLQDVKRLNGGQTENCAYVSRISSEEKTQTLQMSPLECQKKSQQ